MGEREGGTAGSTVMERAVIYIYIYMKQSWHRVSFSKIGKTKALRWMVPVLVLSRFFV